MKVKVKVKEKEKPRLLLVDDEQNVIKSLKRLLIDIDCKILTAESGEDGLKLFEDNIIQVVITDYRMPGMNGVEFLNKVKEKYPDSIRIVLSGYADAGAIVEAINLGHVYKFIPKPWDDHNLLTTVRDAFEKFWLQKENTELYAELSIKYKELQNLTKTLEDRVADRTRDMEAKNKALTVAQNILNYLPVGVIGIDSEATVVYMNKSLKKYIDIKNILLGESAKGMLAKEIYEQMMASIENQESYSIFLNEDQGIAFICSPLPEKAGVIGLFGHFDISKNENQISVMQS